MFKHLIVFIAIGKRRNYVKHNLQFFPQSDCLVYEYKKIDFNMTGCKVIEKPFTWSRFIYDLDVTKIENYDYITIALDDAKILNFSLSKTIEVLQPYTSAVTKPYVVGSYYSKNLLNTKFTEIFVTTFTKQAWVCWWQMIDFLNVDFNSSIGWGFDLCYTTFCPSVKHIKTDAIVYHKFKSKSKLESKLGNQEVRIYNMKVYKHYKKYCETQL